MDSFRHCIKYQPSVNPVFPQISLTAWVEYSGEGIKFDGGELPAISTSLSVYDWQKNEEIGPRGKCRCLSRKRDLSEKYEFAWSCDGRKLFVLHIAGRLRGEVYMTDYSELLEPYYRATALWGTDCY